MRHTYLAAAVFVVVFTGVLLFTHYDKDGSERIADSVGSYSYQCTGGSSFSMTPASDMSYLDLMNAPSAPAELRVTRKEPQTGEGARYEGGGIVFIGTGEGVLIAHGDTDFDCDPVPSQTEAPFNWGDPAEGAGPSQDTAAAVQTNIVGTWQSNEDPSFVREFKAGGIAVDRYENEPDVQATWTVFTGSPKDCDPQRMCEGFFDNVTHVRIRYNENRDDDLYFSIQKLTPDTLEMTYMARGNTLTFKRVQ